MTGLVYLSQYDHHRSKVENDKPLDLIDLKINTKNDLERLSDHITDLLIKDDLKEVEYIYNVLDKKSIRAYNSYLNYNQRDLEYYGFSF